MGPVLILERQEIALLFGEILIAYNMNKWTTQILTLHLTSISLSSEEMSSRRVKIQLKLIRQPLIG